MLDSGPSPSSPPTAADPTVERFSAPVVFVVRLLAAIIALSIWVSVVLVIWSTRLVSTSVYASVASVAAALTGAEQPSFDHIQRIARVWPEGFVAIARAPFAPDSQPTAPPDYEILVREAIVTIAVLGTLIFINAVAGWSSGVLRSLVTSGINFVTWVVGTALSSILGILWQIVSLLWRLL